MVADNSDELPLEEEEPESQQVYYLDDSNDEIASIGRGSDTGGAGFGPPYYPFPC